MNNRPVLLAILDGWGVGVQSPTNAVYMADTPNMDRWAADYPSTTLTAQGEAVGLPVGQMGNSEVGHLNIGAGRVVYQDFTRINRAITTGEFQQNTVLNAALHRAKDNGTAVHLLGLLSDGGVHSHIDHLFALLRMAADQGLERVFVHAFMDGRDTPPTSGADYMRQLVKGLVKIGVGQVATICGRYYAMDRDNHWEREAEAWKALTQGLGVVADEPVAAVETAYAAGENDEFIRPVVLEKNGKPVATINNNDTVIFFNFRADRARQLTRAFTEPGFAGFDLGHRPALAEYVTFTAYDKHFDLPVAFPPMALTNILGEVVSRNGLKQLRIAETEKYAHVTFFFNGGIEKPFENEDRVLIPSPREVATYDLKPEMSALLVTDELEKRLDKGCYDLIVLNFANGDMVGHSGKLAAAIKACETVDQCLGRLAAKIIALGGTMLITADHGNADIMEDPVKGGPFTAHTSNPVPFIMVSEAKKGATLRSGGALKEIAPTILDLLGLEQPVEMEGVSLLK